VQVFRIAKTRYIRDLSGTGAMLYGGRWNHKNIPVIYASESRSLASLEFLVHVSLLPILPKNLSIACLEIPDDIVAERISVSELPKTWRGYPAPPELADIGSKWATSMRSLLLRVPSVVVMDEFNVLINSRHPEMKRVILTGVEHFTFDRRLVRK
jgi:RES domain-containing protein